MWQSVEYCRACGLEFFPDRLSNRGLCEDCAKGRLLEAINMLQAKRGFIWEKWRRNYIAAMSGVLNRLGKESQEHD